MNKYNDFELISYVSESEEANDILYEKYMPLIISLAKKMFNPKTCYGLEINDLIGEGMIGFSTAINTFKENKNTTFFTYARKCVENKITSAIIKNNRKKHQVLNESLPFEFLSNNEIVSLTDIFIDESNIPEKLILDQETTKELDNKLREKLSIKELEVYELKKKGFNYKEIAEILESDPKNIDNAIQRIKTKARTIIEI